MEPPGLIKLEKEIEQEEKAPLPPPSPVSPAPPLSPSPSPSSSPSPSPSPTKCISSKKSTGKLLDDAVSKQFSPSYASSVKLWNHETLYRPDWLCVQYISHMCLCVFQVRHIADDPPCRCPNKFCVERQSQGRYRVGEKMLFIRVGKT